MLRTCSGDFFLSGSTPIMMYCCASNKSIDCGKTSVTDQLSSSFSFWVYMVL